MKFYSETIEVKANFSNFCLIILFGSIEPNRLNAGRLDRTEISTKKSTK